MDKRTENLNRVIEYLTIGLAFLVPVFFLPITSTFFEFNKLVMVAIVTMLMLVLWGIKMLVSKKVFFVKSPLNLPILLVVVVYFAATFFSLNKTISIYGQYGRWFPSLYGILTLTIFYYAVVINLSKERAISLTLTGLLAGITINSVIAIFSYFGLYLGQADYLTNPNFNLVGSVTTTAIMAALAFALGLSAMMHKKEMPLKVVFLQVAIVNLIVLALYNVFAGWATLAVALLAFFAVTSAQKAKDNKQLILAAVGAVIAVVLVVALPQTRPLVQNDNFNKGINLPVTESWVISSLTVTDNPLLGTGPSSFAANFSRYRPLSMNATDSWNVRFDKPHNEIFNILSSFGLIGTLAFLYFTIKVLKEVVRTRKGMMDDSGIQQSLFIGTVVLLSAMLFTYSTVVTMFMLYLFLALTTARLVIGRGRGGRQTDLVKLSLSSLSSIPMMGIAEEKRGGSEMLQYLAIIPVIAVVAVGTLYTYKMYMPEYYIRKAVIAFQANDGIQTYEYQTKAINAFPLRAEYRNTYAQTSLLLANSIGSNENLTAEDQATIQQLIAQAVNETRIATEVIDPTSPRSWEIRAGIYRSLIGAAQDADEWALGAYNNAIQLDPTNPRLRVETGGIYYLNEDYLSAANLFRQATNLKPDYANAHFNLAQAFIKLESYDLAVAELQLVQRLVEPETPDYEAVTAQLKALEELASGQATPTIEQLEQQGQLEEQQETTEQEALTQPGEVTEGVTEEVVLDETGEVQGAENTQETPVVRGEEEEVDVNLEEGQN